MNDRRSSFLNLASPRWDVLSVHGATTLGKTLRSCVAACRLCLRRVASGNRAAPCLSSPFVSSCAVPRVVSYRAVSCRVVSCRACRAVPCRVASCLVRCRIPYCAVPRVPCVPSIF